MTGDSPERVFATYDARDDEWKIQAEGVRSRTSVLPGPYVRTIGYALTALEVVKAFPDAEIFGTRPTS